jgi:DNA mismatch repair ATPase MutS
MYYPAHRKEDAVRNDCNLAENWIITGPNASGKTTYLKTAALNLIFTQQFGMGFYHHCVLYRPYTQFYTYLNIPDTSDRDSLFQAEVRRGKEILDAATLVVPVSGTGSALSATQTPNHKQNIFLLMDELFSGTNHDDAVQAAYGFLCYLGNPARHASTRFLLTTHFVEICDKIQSTAPHVALNGKMMIEDISSVADVETETEETEKGEVEDSAEKGEVEDSAEKGEVVEKAVEKAVEKKGEVGEIRYLYQFKEGISRLRCGIHILKQMNYPKEVMHYF